MEQFARLGRGISIIILICVYTSVWAITTSWIDKKNDNAWISLLSVVWLIIHGLAFLGFLIWSWTY